ncbi:MAG: epoxyqueuosine reductase QueH [Candidatus Aminicenantes bacterium]|nr:epoxyqueuosine reductase QueH [Candidatus Aminicenantes bacterium]
MTRERILVHVCCAPDGAYVLRLLQQNYEPTAFFYNPNIYPPEEYSLRYQEMVKVANWLKVPLIEEKPDFENFLQLTENLKDEPEMGRRCEVCYALRLEKTALRALADKFPFFTTVMSLSPWKKSQTLNFLGDNLAQKYEINFLKADFKKKDGFIKSVALSRELGLYRQDYCGCLYSYLEKQKKKAQESGSKRDKF